MNQDCASVMGKSHVFCQDYARAGTVGEYHYAIVADGCSGTPDSDVGARILTLSALRAIEAGWEFDHSKEQFQTATLSFALNSVQAMGLPHACLQATLLVALAHPKDKKFLFFVAGDGVVGLRRRNGGIVAYKFSFPDVGYYLQYKLARNSLGEPGSQEEQFLEALEKSGGTKPRFTELDPAGKVEHEEDLPGDDLYFKGQCELPLYFEPGDVGFVATDGLCSLIETKKTETSRLTAAIPFPKVLSSFLGFKTMNGQFVARRMKAALSEFAASNASPYDDLSMAAIHVPEA